MLFNNYIKIKKSHPEFSLSLWLKKLKVTLKNMKTLLPLGIMKNIYVLKKFGMLMLNKIIKLKTQKVMIKLTLGKSKEVISDILKKMEQFKQPISNYKLPFSILLLLVIGLNKH
jgi:hypothetical protein